MRPSGDSSLTERTKHVLALAEATANAGGYASVSPVHLALALIDEGEGVAI
jgi:hypothetical protein